MRQNKSSGASTGRPDIDRKITDLLKSWEFGADNPEFREMVVTALNIAKDQASPADIHQLNLTLKELRAASKLFAPYRGVKKITIFGSARTKPSRAEHHAAKKFAHMMMESGYMIITGGGEGIMGAAQAGGGRDKGFALNIQLPFEQKPNATIIGDPKLVNFHYFFTRKLNFVKNASAVALFPGGFGTMDEGFEVITLLQTGKAPIIPIVFVDAPRGNFWRTFEHYLREHLLADKLISPEDFNLFKITDNLEEAQKEVVNFYYNFHSYRYVRDLLVIRLQREVPDGALVRLRDDFSDILTKAGGITKGKPLPEEKNEPEFALLPRLIVKFNRHGFGRLRQLIDRLNQF